MSVHNAKEAGNAFQKIIRDLKNIEVTKGEIERALKMMHGNTRQEQNNCRRLLSVGESRIMKYQKKPVIVDAFQYDGDLKGTDGNYYVPDWAVEAYEKGIMHYGVLKLGESPYELFVDTVEGTRHVSVGDYVIRGIKGELYPCKPDIFIESYEPENK